MPQLPLLVVRSTQLPEQDVGVVPLHTAVPPPLAVPAMLPAPPVPAVGVGDGSLDVPESQPKISSGAAAKRQAQSVLVRMLKTWHRFHNIPSGKLPVKRARERFRDDATNFDR